MQKDEGLIFLSESLLKLHRIAVPERFFGEGTVSNNYSRYIGYLILIMMIRLKCFIVL